MTKRSNTIFHVLTVFGVASQHATLADAWSARDALEATGLAAEVRVFTGIAGRYM